MRAPGVRSDMTWIKLERGNDWGFQYLAVKALTSDGYANARDLRHPFAEGEDVEARFPDGTVDTMPVKHRTFRNEVSDHGHTNFVRCELPGIEVSHRGLCHWVPLDQVEVSSDSLDRHRATVEADPSRDPNGRA